MTEFQLKIQQRHKNYVEYYEVVEPTKIYTIEELNSMTEMELLDIMPQNQCIEKYSESMGCNVLQHIVCFEMNKIIDGSWNIGYYEGHRDKPMKDQVTLYELTYVRNLKKGLIDLYLWVQNKNIKYMQDIKDGNIKVLLGESWDDRKRLGLN